MLFLTLETIRACSQTNKYFNSYAGAKTCCPDRYSFRSNEAKESIEASTQYSYTDKYLKSLLEGVRSSMQKSNK